MSFFERADILVADGGLFEGTSTLQMLALVVACQQQENLRRDENNNPTSLTMSRAARASFRAQYDLSADQYQGLVDLCDEGGEVGDVFAAYHESLPNEPQGGASRFVRRSVKYSGESCLNESCEDVAMKVSHVESTFYGVDECYPMRHYVKTCRGGCGARYSLNKRRERAPDGMTWHIFYAWEQGIPEEISSKSGKCVMSVPFLTQVALTLSRMRWVKDTPVFNTSRFASRC